MPNAKRPIADPSSYSVLSARFEGYVRDVPQNGFPTFLESLLFDSEGKDPATRPSRRRVRVTSTVPGARNGADAAPGSCGFAVRK